MISADSSAGQEVSGIEGPVVGPSHSPVAGADVAGDAVCGFLSSYLGSVRGAICYEIRTLASVVDAGRSSMSLTQFVKSAEVCQRILVSVHVVGRPPEAAMPDLTFVRRPPE